MTATSCNGEERCVGTGKFRRCALGEPLRCLDRNLCTIDSCDPVEGCRHELTDCPTTTTLPPATTTTTAPPSTSTTSTTTTSASSTSTSTTSTTRPHDGCGAAPTCDDADPCTTDACGAGGCTHDERPGLGYVACVLDERLSPRLRDAHAAATSGRARRLAKKAIAREAKVSTLLARIMDGTVSSRRLTRSARLIGSLGRMIERGRGQLGDAPADAIGGEIALAGARLNHEIGVPAAR